MKMMLSVVLAKTVLLVVLPSVLAGKYGPSQPLAPAPPSVTSYGPVVQPPSAAGGQYASPAVYPKPAFGSSGYAKATVEKVPWPPQPYQFGYEIDDGYGSTQYRKEESDANNRKKGSYGFRDAQGVYRYVDYVADEDGFRAWIRTNEPGTSNQDPASVNIVAEDPPYIKPVASNQLAKYPYSPGANVIAARPPVAPVPAFSAPAPAALPHRAPPAPAVAPVPAFSYPYPNSYQASPGRVKTHLNFGPNPSAGYHSAYPQQGPRISPPVPVYKSIRKLPATGAIPAPTVPKIATPGYAYTGPSYPKPFAPAAVPLVSQPIAYSPRDYSKPDAQAPAPVIKPAPAPSPAINDDEDPYTKELPIPLGYVQDGQSPIPLDVFSSRAHPGLGNFVNPGFPRHENYPFRRMLGVTYA